jgi:hypothetical protein
VCYFSYEELIIGHGLSNLKLLILIDNLYCSNTVNLVLQLRKKTVKEQKAEKRKTKVRKHVKKRKEKLQQKKK